MALVRWVMKPGGDYYDCSRCGCSCREDNLDVHEQYHENLERALHQVASFTVELIQSMGGRIPDEAYRFMGLPVPDNKPDYEKMRKALDDARPTNSSIHDSQSTEAPPAEGI